MPTPEQQTGLDAKEWIAQNFCSPPKLLVKDTNETSAWLGHIGRQPVFAKWFPTRLVESWADVEAQISSSRLHPCIVPLLRVVECLNGVIHLYPWVPGESLGSVDARKRFLQLPISLRIGVALNVARALAAIADAGFYIVDWYEGNMIFDWHTNEIWLLDWELCRHGRSMLLEMDQNYGTSRLMAPEEFVRGSVLKESTLVFNLGRFFLGYLPELAIPLASILAKATYPDAAGRHETLAELTTDLECALTDQTSELRK